MKKYNYRCSAFGRIRQEKAKKANEKKTYKTCPWKVYSM